MLEAGVFSALALKDIVSCEGQQQRTPDRSISLQSWALQRVVLSALVLPLAFPGWAAKDTS